MTMQVAMKCKDGILLASDTYFINLPILDCAQLWVGGRHGTDRTKFRVNHVKGIAIACAGDMDTAGLIAEAVVSGWENSHLRDPEAALERFCESVPDAYRHRAECVVVVTRPAPQMFIVKTMPNNSNDWEPWCRSSLTMLIAGDTVNAAIFWIEKYYRKWRLLSLPMERLIPLAAHMIGQAKTLNTAGIGGLEILLCNSREIQRLSKDSCESLERQSEQWDEAIGDLLLNHHPQYIYDPNTDV